VRNSEYWSNDTRKTGIMEEWNDERKKNTDAYLDEFMQTNLTAALREKILDSGSRLPEAALVRNDVQASTLVRI